MHQPNEYKKEDIYGNPKTPSKSVGTIRCENNDITPIKTKDVKYILLLAVRNSITVAIIRWTNLRLVD